MYTDDAYEALGGCFIALVILLVMGFISIPITWGFISWGWRTIGAFWGLW